MSIPRLRPVAQFVGIGVVGTIGIFALVYWIAGGMPPAALSAGMLTFGAAMATATAAFSKSYPHNAVGWCNAVTMFRLMLVSVLISCLCIEPRSAWLIFGIALLAFCLDGVDGWLARREGYVSGFGARFDMEVDSLLALVVAVHALQSGSAGLLVICLALPRYAFYAGQWFLPWLNNDLPPRFSRKVVCVIQLGVLILLLLPIDIPFADAIMVTALAIVGWSFWLDVRWLWQERG